MKNYLLLFFLFLGIQTSLLALDASVSFCTFHSEEQNYVEVYMHFVGETLRHKTLEGEKLQAGAEVLIVFKNRLPDGRTGEEIIKIDKFNLDGPVSDKRIDFIDLKRYSLPNGEYQLIIDVVDRENPINKRQFSTPIIMAYEKETLGQSDIQLLAGIKQADSENSLVKNGVEMEPLPFNWYHKKADELIFYNEIYNSDKVIGDAYFISYSIQGASNKNTGKPILTKYKRLEPATVNPVLQKMDISELPSGNYLFNVEIRDRTKNILSQKALFFQRSNPNADPLPDTTVTQVVDQFAYALEEDMVEYSIRAISALVPADNEMLNTVISEENYDAQRIYLQSFWAKQHPEDPRKQYQDFMNVARAVDREFESGFGHGFETARGQIYIKYGQPDDIVRVEDEATAPPYEIWSYNTINRTKQANVRFLFYNPSLSPGNFQLLHSNARGEMNNPQWQLELYREAPNDVEGGNYIDGTQVIDGYGRRAAELFNDF